MLQIHDIMSLKEKQATAKPAFAFQGELTNKHFCVAESKALQERVCESDVNSGHNRPKRKASDDEAGISFSGMLQRANFLRSRK